MDLFSNLFKSHDCQPSSSLFRVDSIKVTDSKKFFLISIPLDEEIKAVVFVLKQNSSLGPDGFNGVFYTLAWRIIG